MLGVVHMGMIGVLLLLFLLLLVWEGVFLLFYEGRFVVATAVIIVLEKFVEDLRVGLVVEGGGGCVVWENLMD